MPHGSEKEHGHRGTAAAFGGILGGGRCGIVSSSSSLLEAPKSVHDAIQKRVQGKPNQRDVSGPLVQSEGVLHEIGVTARVVDVVIFVGIASILWKDHVGGPQRIVPGDRPKDVNPHGHHPGRPCRQGRCHDPNRNPFEHLDLAGFLSGGNHGHGGGKLDARSV